jgi:hypothetical protein
MHLFDPNLDHDYYFKLLLRKRSRTPNQFLDVLLHTIAWSVLSLGDRNNWYCVLDKAGQIQLEQRVRTSAKALQEVFSVMPRSQVALETGTH